MIVKWQCPYCPKTHQTMSAMEKHLKKYHNKTRKEAIEFQKVKEDAEH